MDLKTEIVYPPSWWWFPDHNIYTTFLVCLFWILLFTYFLMFRDTSPTPTRQSSTVPLIHAQSSLICESVEWFNYLVKKWWKFSKQSTENLICETMNKIMSSSLPPFIDSFEVNYVDLGNKPPVIRNIRIYDSLLATLENFSLNSVRTQKVCMELDIGLPCEDFTLILSGRGVPHLVCLMLQRLYFEATVRFILTLDKEVPFPHTAKARISFKEQRLRPTGAPRSICKLTNDLNSAKSLVFLAGSGNPFHALIALGKKEHFYKFVLAYEAWLRPSRISRSILSCMLTWLT